MYKIGSLISFVLFITIIICFIIACFISNKFNSHTYHILFQVLFYVTGTFGLLYFVLINLYFIKNIYQNIYEIYYVLMLNDESLIKLDFLSNNCFNNNYTLTNQEIRTFNNLKSDGKGNDELKYDKDNKIPIKCKNDNLKSKDNDGYQDLFIRDFFWTFSYKTYLTGSIYNGQPSYDSIINAIKNYNVRGIHLDVYSNSSIIGNKNAKPVVKSDVLYSKFKPLDLYKSLKFIKIHAWKETNLPIFLYLTLNFYPDPVIYNKIYYALTKIFSNNLMGPKYSFSGRNKLYSINNIPIKDSFNKIILITNRYPTNSKLDELINGDITNQIREISMDKYTKDMIEYGGFIIKHSETDFIENNKKNIYMFFSNNSDNKQTLMNPKVDLLNPDFIDCCKAGVQFCMMSLHYPNKFLYDWYKFFQDNTSNSDNNDNTNKKMKYCILKNRKLRYIYEKVQVIKRKKIKEVNKFSLDMFL